MARVDMPGSTNRPLFHASIAQLEGIFERNRGDLTHLCELELELGFRSTERANKLRGAVSIALRSAEMAARVEPAPASREPSRRTKSSAAKPVSEPRNPKELSAIKNASEPERILSAWIATEALSPQTFRRPEDLIGGDWACVVELDRHGLPWKLGERSRPKKMLYYQVVLGSIQMQETTRRLMEIFGEDDEKSSRSREKAAMAVAVVDKEGRLVEDGIAVSSFIWALPRALTGKLEGLGEWVRIEPVILAQLEKILRCCDEEGTLLPLDEDAITSAFQYLMEFCSIPDGLTDPPSFVLRHYHYYKAKGPPAPLVLNSFYFADLSTASDFFRQGQAPEGLRRYLGLDCPASPADLLANRDLLEKAISPASFPLGRWPASGGYPLVSLQQAAVNLVRARLCGKEGILAINGPPGTGKTTLLRDLVANCVIDRACAMCEFENPANAFVPSGVKHTAGEHYFVHIYRLSEALKGHEILVASTNNKAVENISRELPARQAVGRPLAELRYFDSISKRFCGEDAWGMIAAVLGNAANRMDFQREFWWNDDTSFRLYLKAAKGDDLLREIRDPQTGRLIERRMPAIVATENPPTPHQAAINWRVARQKYLELEREVRDELSALEAIRVTCLEFSALSRQLHSEDAELGTLCRRRDPLERQVAALRATLELLHSRRVEARRALESHRLGRPAFWHRWLRTERWVAWFLANEPLMNADAAAAQTYYSGASSLENAKQEHSALAEAIERLESSILALKDRVGRLRAKVESARTQLGERVVDEDFFTLGREHWNVAAPWVPDRVHRRREDLFAAALDLHRAFIDVAAQKFLHNLSVLMDVMAGGTPKGPEKRLLLNELWSTLFLVIPVMSTTFASVGRMLADLPPASIGWLLIDEAGQAVPQAAVGAILRARRSVVVGDPLQIPPVVTLPDRLIEQVCAYFGVAAADWAGPEASAQTLGDRAADFQTTFDSDRGPRRVGLPLLVHRRCREPIFSIFNRIAYDNQMVLAPALRTDSESTPLEGPSAWFDLDGEATTKWCPAEGEKAIELMRMLVDGTRFRAEMFIVTPFRMVAQEMRRRLHGEPSLHEAMGADPQAWIDDRVGTIHTVQGREADIVFLILGAPGLSHGGARKWAAGIPNILNVAVSRAKRQLCVIGSRAAWVGIGYARELRDLPVRHL